MYHRAVRHKYTHISEKCTFLNQRVSWTSNWQPATARASGTSVNVCQATWRHIYGWLNLKQYEPPTVEQTDITLV
jgi:hypothetical protein